MEKAGGESAAPGPGSVYEFPWHELAEGRHPLSAHSCTPEHALGRSQRPDGVYSLFDLLRNRVPSRSRCQAGSGRKAR